MARKRRRGSLRNRARMSARAKAQKMAKRNIKKFGGTASAARANKAAGRARAKARYQSSLRAKMAERGDTAGLVRSDNKMYGNTVPSGSFGISREGRALAAKNRAEAAARRTVPSGSFNISAAGRQQAAANRAAVTARQQEAARQDQRAAESRRLAAENSRRIAAERAAAQREAARVAAAKREAERAAAARREAERRAAAEAKRRAEAEAKRKAEEKRQRMFDSARLDSTAAPATNKLQDNIQKIRETQTNFKNLTDAAAAQDTRVLSRVDNTNVGGLPTSPGFGDRAGRFFSNAYDSVTGGLNFGEAAQAATQQGGLNIGQQAATDKPRSLTSRALGTADLAIGALAGREITDFDRMGNAKILGVDVNPPDVVRDAVTVAGKIRNNELSIGDAFGIASDTMSIVNADNKLKTIGEMNTNDLTRLATKGYDLAKDSAVVQTTGERLGLPTDFKQQFDTAKNEVSDKYLSGVKIGDRDSVYKAISDFNRDIGTNPNLSLVARQAESFRTGEGTTMDKIVAGFQKDAPRIKGLSAAERGLLGAAGNRIISGKQTDIAREAMSGMKIGDSLNARDLTKIAQNVITDTAPGAQTLSAKRASEIKSLISDDKDLTPRSFIEGLTGLKPRKSKGATSLQGGGGSSNLPESTVEDAMDTMDETETETADTTTTETEGEVPTTETDSEISDIQDQMDEATDTDTDTGTDADYTPLTETMDDEDLSKLLAIDPNYTARFQMRRRRRRRGGFRKAFSRRFFS